MNVIGLQATEDITKIITDETLEISNQTNPDQASCPINVEVINMLV